MPKNDNRKTGESVSDFLQIGLYGPNRTKYTATHNRRFGRYGSDEPEISLEDMNATLREDEEVKE